MLKIKHGAGPNLLIFFKYEDYRYYIFLPYIFPPWIQSAGFVIFSSKVLSKKGYKWTRPHLLGLVGGGVGGVAPSVVAVVAGHHVVVLRLVHHLHLVHAPLTVLQYHAHLVNLDFKGQCHEESMALYQIRCFVRPKH